MNSVIKASVALAVFVVVVSTATYLTGLHENPLAGLGSLVLFIGATIAVVFWGLKQTAGENGYGRQFGNAALIGLIGGVLVFAGSMLLFTVFPDYLEEVKTAQIAGLEQWNLSEDQLETQIAKIEATTPVGSSLQGKIGSVVTCLIVGAIVAIFKRKKS